MTDTHALQALRDKVAAGVYLMDVLAPKYEMKAYEAFSGSFDAFLALKDAVLPGWDYMIDDCRPNDVAKVELGSVVSVDTGLDGEMPISRLGLLAILDALIYETNETSDKA